jgi:exoribonuclease II
MDEMAEILDRLINKEHLTAIKYVTIQNEPNDYDDKLGQDKYVQI